MVLVQFSQLPSPIQYPHFIFPAVVNHPSASESPSVTMNPDVNSSSMSSASSLSVVTTFTKTTVVLAIQTLQAEIKHLEGEVARLTLQQEESEKRRKADREEFKKLKRWVALNEKKRRDAEAEAKQAAATAEHDSEKESDEDIKMLTESEKLAIEASTAAVASNVMKVS